MTETVNIDGYRFYIIDGEYYPSVTSILSMKPNPDLEQWKKRYSKKQIDAVLHYTGIRGEIIHYAALNHYESDSIIQSDPPPDSVNIASSDPKMIIEIDIALKLFCEFNSRYDLTPTAIEKVVWNHEHRYAGRLDFEGYLYDKKLECDIPVIMDIKTSKMIYRNYLSLQLSGYNLCLQDASRRMYCLLLHPGETEISGITVGSWCRYWDFQEMSPNYEAFLYYLKLFNINLAKIREEK